MLYLTHGKYVNTAKKGKLMNNHHHVLLNITERTSRFGGNYYEIRFYDIEDNMFMNSCVYPAMDNWHRQGWSELVHDPRPWGVYSGARVSVKKGQAVINADTRPKLEASFNTQQQAQDWVQECQLKHAGPNPRVDLFDYGT